MYHFEQSFNTPISNQLRGGAFMEQYNIRNRYIKDLYKCRYLYYDIYNEYFPKISTNEMYRLDKIIDNDNPPKEILILSLINNKPYAKLLQSYLSNSKILSNKTILYHMYFGICYGTALASYITQFILGFVMYLTGIKLFDLFWIAVGGFLLTTIFSYIMCLSICETRVMGIDRKFAALSRYFSLILKDEEENTEELTFSINPDIPTVLSEFSIDDKTIA